MNRRRVFRMLFLGGIAAISGMPLRTMAAEPIHVVSTAPSGPSITSAELRTSIDRSGALERGSASLPAGAASDPRLAWFPIVLAFSVDGCLAGAYELDFVSQLSFDCQQGAARMADLFPDLELGRFPKDGLLLIVVPVALAAMCEPCSRVRPTVEAELRQRGVRPALIDVDLILF